MKRVLLGMLLPACLPHSMVMGQTGRMPVGGADIGVATGVSYAHTSDASSESNSVGVPNLEGNVLLGLSEHAGLNLHASPAGIQPGLMLNLLSGKISLSILPQAAISYGTVTDDSGNKQTSLGVLAGARIFVAIGQLYFGTGYDHQWSQQTGSSSTSGSTIQGENIYLGVGYEAKAGKLILRPELDGLFEANITDGSGTTDPQQIMGVVASLTFALSTGR